MWPVMYQRALPFNEWILYIIAEVNIDGWQNSYSCPYAARTRLLWTASRFKVSSLNKNMSWPLILHLAEKGNLSPSDSKIACLCHRIEINNNKHIYPTFMFHSLNTLYVCWSRQPGGISAFNVALVRIYNLYHLPHRQSLPIISCC